MTLHHIKPWLILYLSSSLYLGVIVPKARDSDSGKLKSSLFSKSVVKYVKCRVFGIATDYDQR